MALKNHQVKRHQLVGVSVPCWLTLLIRQQFSLCLENAAQGSYLFIVSFRTGWNRFELVTLWNFGRNGTEPERTGMLEPEDKPNRKIIRFNCLILSLPAIQIPLNFLLGRRQRCQTALYHRLAISNTGGTRMGRQRKKEEGGRADSHSIRLLKWDVLTFNNCRAKTKARTRARETTPWHTPLAFLKLRLPPL